MFIKQVRLINNLITKEVDDVKWRFDINNKCIGYNLLSDNDIVQRVEYNPDFDMFTLTEKGTVTKIIVHANRNEDKINLIKRIIKYKRSKLNPAIKKV